MLLLKAVFVYDILLFYEAYFLENTFWETVVKERNVLLTSSVTLAKLSLHKQKHQMM